MGGVMDIAVSGMSAQSSKLEVIANNIANSGTLAYKNQTLQFSEAMVSSGMTSSNGTTIQYGTGAEVASITSDWTTGSSSVTNDEYDFLISGDGFVEVSLNDDTYYTRACDFTLTYDSDSTEYTIQLASGASLMGSTDTVDPTTGDSTAYTAGLGVITFTEAPASIELSSDGTLTATYDDGTTDTYYVAVTTFSNNDSLETIGSGLYHTTEYSGDGTIHLAGDDCGSLTQGALEESNTDLVTEFTDMIETQRAFQANSKVITTQDELLNTIINM